MVDRRFAQLALGQLQVDPERQIVRLIQRHATVAFPAVTGLEILGSPPATKRLYLTAAIQVNCARNVFPWHR